MTLHLPDPLKASYELDARDERSVIQLANNLKSITNDTAEKVNLLLDELRDLDPGAGWDLVLKKSGALKNSQVEEINFTGDVTVTSTGIHSVDVNISTSGATNQERSAMTCTSTESVLDVVYLTGSNSVGIAKADDISTAKAFGFIKSKESTVECTVIMSGIVTGLSGLIPGRQYFLSATTAGRITSTVPTSGVIVRLGQAITSSILKLNIDENFIVRA